MPRLSSKVKYVVAISNLFKSKGLHLNMEQIAQELNITKKTLYNNFENKDDMIKTVIEHFYIGLDARMMIAADSSKNAIEELLQNIAVIREEVNSLGDVLLADLAKENESLFSFTGRTSYYSKVIMANLKRGIDEGLYRSDMDMEYTTLFYTSVINTFYRKDDVFRFLEQSDVFHSELIKYHLYSIVKREYRALLESYL